VCRVALCGLAADSAQVISDRMSERNNPSGGNHRQVRLGQGSWLLGFLVVKDRVLRRGVARGRLQVRRRRASFYSFVYAVFPRVFLALADQAGVRALGSPLVSRLADVTICSDWLCAAVPGRIVAGGASAKESDPTSPRRERGKGIYWPNWRVGLVTGRVPARGASAEMATMADASQPNCQRSRRSGEPPKWQSANVAGMTAASLMPQLYTYPLYRTQISGSAQIDWGRVVWHSCQLGHVLSNDAGGYVGDGRRVPASHWQSQWHTVCAILYTITRATRRTWDTSGS
jgi:hypothetical protein